MAELNYESSDDDDQTNNKYTTTSSYNKLQQQAQNSPYPTFNPETKAKSKNPSTNITKKENISRNYRFNDNDYDYDDSEDDGIQNAEEWVQEQSSLQSQAKNIQIESEQFKQHHNDPYSIYDNVEYSDEDDVDDNNYQNPIQGDVQNLSAPFNALTIYNDPQRYPTMNNYDDDDESIESGLVVIHYKIIMMVLLLLYLYFMQN